MRAVNFFGSSHLSAKHGLPLAIRKKFSQMDQQFKLKFKLTEVLGYPGATFYHDNLLDKFVKTASDQTNYKGYNGQINVIILGSNDQREVSNLTPVEVKGALRKFKNSLTQLIDRMLSIKNSTLILATSVLPKQHSGLQMEKIVRQVVR